jgi:hypothetical protein
VGRDLKPIFDSRGLQSPVIPGMMSEIERRSSLASIAVAPMNRGSELISWQIVDQLEALEVPVAGTIEIEDQP